MLPLVGLGVAFVAGPLIALLAAIPWARVPELVATREAQSAFALTLLTASASTAACATIGVPMALWMRRWLEIGRPTLVGLAQVLIYAPLVLSPVVSGLALTFVWGRRGVLGEWLDAAGIPLAYTPWGVIVVQVFVSLPFFVATAVTALRAIPRSLEEAAATEGATRAQTLRHIVLPLAAPGVGTGAVISFARAVSEFGATITFAGNVEGQSRTIPLLISLGLSSGDMDQALGACILLLGVYGIALGMLAAARMLPRGGMRG
ncbi:molybdenum ABC transporter permease [Corynebacterium liangguodongii]|uniref:Molybdenum ABC transporter permease n=1 Tax=Corynebacterium liangguodongii TaxID=2079535 RepID=A0A2S0WH52_9CORY|nr:molybdenum ABC transporter permease [Corynebacterium liangguodongii]PWB99104.1 molybdenum ABC transporter permease [Corynebacterium liangguodongii]